MLHIKKMKYVLEQIYVVPRFIVLKPTVGICKGNGIGIISEDVFVIESYGILG